MAVKTKKSKNKGASRAGNEKPTHKKPLQKKPLRKGPDTEVDEEVLEFIASLDAYKKERNRPFPTWSEVLQVLKQLGYRKV